jgi:DNA-directed RNA polymerase subunit RPC12/RpoP
LLTTTDTYESIHNKYNISIGRISEINTGKIWFNQQLSYPLRNTSAKQQLCIDCGKPTSGPRYIRCSSCSRKHTIVPLDKMLVTRDELKNLIRQYSFVEIGRKFSVTDNSIRKWCIKFNLPSRKKDIKQYTDEEWAKI